MKKVLWQVHSLLGLIAGLGLLVIGVTGSLLVFRDEIDSLVAPALMRVEPSAAGRLSWAELLTAAHQAWPAHEIVGFGPRREAGLADLVYVRKLGGNEIAAGTLNPYTGVALGSPSNPNQTFTGILLELHYTWYAGHVGMLITGIFAVLFCLLGITGVWLYRDFWRHFFTLRWRRGARLFFSDLHKMVGISSVGFNMILGFTGAYWNLAHVAEDGLGHHENTAGMEGRFYEKSLPLDQMSATAAESMPGFKTRWISFPSSKGEDITLWGKMPSANPFASDYGSSAVFDATTGVLKKSSALKDAGMWAVITDSFGALHFGTFGGWPIRILWCLGGLAPGVLAVSGFLIWYRRHRRKKPTVSAS